jgi:hypothetical protein
MMRRRSVAKSVNWVFKGTPEVLEELKGVLEAADFKGLLEEAIANPNSPAAKEMEEFFHGIIARTSVKVPYTMDSQKMAFAQMLALNRFFSNGAFFVTHAPVTWKFQLMYRYAKTHKTNACNLQGDNTAIPETNNLRKIMKLEWPYADVLVFSTVIRALIQCIAKISTPPMLTNKHHVAPLPWTRRDPGLYGPIMAHFTCTETSADGNLHSHSKYYGPMAWSFLEDIAADPVLNQMFGLYVDSIITTELTDRDFAEDHGRYLTRM